MKFERPPEREWPGDWALALPDLSPWVQAAVLLLIALILGWQAWRWLRPPNPRPCRWKRDRARPRAGMARWACATCGVDAFSRDGRPPKECKRGLKEAGL